MRTTLTVTAPKTPGAQATAIGEARSIADARKIAEQFADRRDLTRQDVAIWRGDRRVEYAGPCR